MLKIVCISDTHGGHCNIKSMPTGDVLIHSGDCTSESGQAALRDFLRWFESQPFEHKILIAGNHDGAFQKWPPQAKAMVAQEAPSVHHLENSGVTIHGFNFWGSPYTPEFFDWYFMAKRGDDIQRHWDLIPQDTDVLVTHGPPAGILDENERGVKCGCNNLLNTIQSRLPDLKLHIFGHIHKPGGYTQKIGNTTFINAAVMDDNYMVCRAPIIFYLEHAATT